MIVDRILEYGLDTSHFTLQGTNRGRDHVPPKKTHVELLIKRVAGGRRAGALLTRAMKEAGVPYVCAECGLLPEWNDKLLRLEVDHSNGDRSDDRLENLRFLCPNCHSQMETSCRQKKRIVTVAELQADAPE